MSSSVRLIAPEYIRLSGEIADQGILNHLAQVYPKARIAHAFATTEAGVAFEVNYVITGFPLSVLTRTPGVELRCRMAPFHSLRAHSGRYLDEEHGRLKDADGFVDTTDIVDLRNQRYYFVGRRDGVINVGGLKVHPEEVEEVINCYPEVRISLVRTKKNPITGALGVADVVLRPAAGPESDGERQIQQDILLLCREELASHKVPATINFVLRWRLLSRGSSFDAMRNVIVTGGSKGLGLGIAGKLAKQGYRAIAIARKESPELTALMQRDGEPGCVQFAPFDLADLEGIAGLVKKLRKDFGPIYGW